MSKNIISESYYFSPEENELYRILESKREDDGSKTAVLQNINGEYKLVYDYKIKGCSISWLHGISYEYKEDAHRSLLAEQKKAQFPIINSNLKR